MLTGLNASVFTLELRCKFYYNINAVQIFIWLFFREFSEGIEIGFRHLNISSILSYIYSIF